MWKVQCVNRCKYASVHMLPYQPGLAEVSPCSHASMQASTQSAVQMPVAQTRLSPSRQHVTQSICNNDHSICNAHAFIPAPEACAEVVCKAAELGSRARSLGSREGLEGGRPPCCMARCVRKSVSQLRHLHATRATALLDSCMKQGLQHC